MFHRVIVINDHQKLTENVGIKEFKMNKLEVEFLKKFIKNAAVLCWY